MRALTVKEVLKQKKRTFAFKGEWKEAFGEPERTGVWFIWGNSGNGKSSFVMQLCKYLCEFERVAYDSLEEGDSLSIQNAVVRAGFAPVVLQPVNFEALYAARLQQEQEQAANASA